MDVLGEDMGNFLDSKNYQLGFQIHHIFTTEVFDIPALEPLFTSIGLQLEMEGNKVALPTSEGTAKLFKDNAAFRSLLPTIGWGSELLNPTNDNHITCRSAA